MSDNTPPRLTETEATQLAHRAVDLAGGARMIYRSPRQAFSPDGRREIVVDGHAVDVRWGEISSPAIATVGGYVFEILDGWIELLVRPPKPRS